MEGTSSFSRGAKVALTLSVFPVVRDELGGAALTEVEKTT